MTYATETMVENYLAIDIDNAFSSQITAWAESVDVYINNYTGKNFTLATETRYFDGNGEKELTIDNFTSLSSIQILANNSDDVEFTLTEGAGSDFITWPYNTTPKTKLIMTVNSQMAVWPSGVKRIKLTGAWGHQAAVPKDIELAATMLLAGIIEKGLKGGAIQSESLGDYSVTFKDFDSLAGHMGVKDILEKYKVYSL